MAQQKVHLQLSRDPKTMFNQIFREHPSDNNHVSYVELYEDGRIKALYTIWMGTNCGMYWGIGRHFDGNDERVLEEGECDIDDKATLKKVIKQFCEFGLAAVLVFNTNGEYQYKKLKLERDTIIIPEFVKAGKLEPVKREITYYELQL